MPSREIYIRLLSRVFGHPIIRPARHDLRGFYHVTAPDLQCPLVILEE